MINLKSITGAARLQLGAVGIAALLFATLFASGAWAQDKVTPDEARKIAKEAYIFNYSLVLMYRTMYLQAIDKNSKSYSGGFGKWLHLGTSSPKDTDIVSPNNDSPYSYAWVDTRAEPWVLTMPKIEAKRYYTSQWDDLWGYVLDNPGSVKDGNDGVSVLLASPAWKGELPKGVKRVIQGDTDFLGTLTRTQLFEPSDLPNVKKIQSEYKLQPLSAYLGKTAPKAASPIQWKPWKEGSQTTNEFWDYVNFLLPLTTPNPQDKPSLDKMAKIGLGAKAAKPSAEILAARAEGMKDALAEVKKAATGSVDPALFFRSRKNTGGDYKDRALGVFMGIFGNEKKQAVYFSIPKDDKGELFDGSKHNYQVKFTADQIPPVKYFWSFTMYKMPQRWLVANSLKRYSIGSATPGLKKDADGSITIYFQAKSPGKDKESNWLPAPAGPFWPVLRTYGPGKPLLDKTWKLPPVKQVGATASTPTQKGKVSDDATVKQAHALGVQAYIWGYPMVVMQKSRDAMTKAGDAPVTAEQFNKSGKLFAPVNQVANAWGMLGPKFSAVQSGNSDTQYSVTWFDSSKEPYVLHLPNAKGRYYTFQFIDAYTNNFHYASTRTKGSQEQSYALVAPGWNGSLPKGVTRVDSPTPTGFVIGRWFVQDEKDVAAVNKLQKQVTMTPLSSFGKKYTPPKIKVVPAKKYKGDLAFFEQLGDALVINGAPDADAGLLGLLKNIGLTTNYGFDASALSDGEKKSLAQAVTDGKAMLAAKSAAMGKTVNGWQLSPVLDEYFGTDYLFRAAIGYQAMFVNTPIEAYYPGVFKDTDGKALDGSSGKYTITFPKGKTPPVGAFWSTTMYDAKKRLMVENSIKRYKIGSADKMKPGSDGSITIYIQADSPGKDKESSWLPAPKEPFYMLFRMYQPDIEVLNGQYQLPGVVRVK